MSYLVSSHPVSVSTRYVFADTVRRNRSLMGACLLLMAIPALLIVGVGAFLHTIVKRVFFTS
jgi:hypothetical protein